MKDRYITFGDLPIGTIWHNDKDKTKDYRYKYKKVDTDSIYTIDDDEYPEDIGEVQQLSINDSNFSKPSF